MKLQTEFKGIKDTFNLFDEFIPAQSRRLMQATVYGIAAESVKEVRRNTPVGRGVLRKSVKARNLKSHRDRPNAVLYFQAGSGVKNDGFHWRFLEHGTQARGNHPGIRPVGFVWKSRNAVLARLPQIVEARYKKALERAAKAEAKKREKR